MGYRRAELKAQARAYRKRCDAARAPQVVQVRKPLSIAQSAGFRVSVTAEDAFRRRG